MFPSRNRAGAVAPAKPDARGFTLLEVIVAFSILAVSLGVIFQAFGTGATNARLAERYTHATLHAESRLAAIGVERALTEGLFDGDLPGPYRWRSSVTPVEEGDVPDGAGDRVERRSQTDQQLYDVVVTVDWTEGGKTRSVSLRTTRLGKRR